MDPKIYILRRKRRYLSPEFIPTYFRRYVDHLRSMILGVQMAK
jgi:hypothetical protein